MKKIENYVTNVVKAAFVSEHREVPSLKEIKVNLVFVGGKKILWVSGVLCDYCRVRRRIEYRLENNIRKHFPDLVFDEVNFYNGICVEATILA